MSVILASVEISVRDLIEDSVNEMVSELADMGYVSVEVLTCKLCRLTESNDARNIFSTCALLSFLSSAVDISRQIYS